MRSFQRASFSLRLINGGRNEVGDQKKSKSNKRMERSVGSSEYYQPSAYYKPRVLLLAVKFLRFS